MDLSFPAAARSGKKDTKQLIILAIQCKTEKIQNK
jgi:hypothetical protein